MTNFWKDKYQFWRNKTLNNPTYEKQKKEAAGDILSILHTFNLKKVCDLGGYDGALGKCLPDVEYLCLDIKDGFDMSSDWVEQQFRPDEETLLVTSLTFLVLSPDQMVRTVSNFKTYGRLAYCYEEQWDGEDDELFIQINDDYGGKWHHNLPKYFAPNLTDSIPSWFNPNWHRTIINLSNHENISFPSDNERGN